MKYFIFIFASFFLINFRSSAVEDPGLEKAKTLCSLVTPSPQFNYEDLFADSVKNDFPKEILVKVFAAIHTSHGACVKAEGENHPAVKSGLRIYFLTLRDGYRSVFKFRVNQKARIDVLAYDAEIFPTNYGIQLREQFMLTTEGTLLRTWIFGKDLTQKKPVVQHRTPYTHNYGLLNYGNTYITAQYFVDRGYHFVVQAIRGTGGSQGEFKFINPQEIDDGFDLVNWIAKQDFCDGNVGASGTSFDGFTALAAAVRNPAALKVVFAGGYVTHFLTDAFVRNGVLLLHYLDYLRHTELGEGQPFSSDFLEKAGKAFNEPDLRKYDKLIFGTEILEWQRVAANFPDTASPFWKTRQIRNRIPEIQIPTYHIAGMRRDGDMPDVVNGFSYINEHSKFKDRHRMILGYWDHGNSTPYAQGAALSPFMKERYDSLLAHYLKHQPSPYLNEPRVQVASNLNSKFIGSENFPLSNLRQAVWYFKGEGEKLTFSEDKVKGEAEFPYQMLPLVLNQLEKSEPKQSLIFTRTVDRDLPLLGAFHFDLYFKISTPQTDLMILLSKLDKEGKEQFVSSCITAQKVFNTAPVMGLHLTSCPVLNKLLAGETLKVIVTSNLFPAVARNTNNALENYYEKFTESKITLLSSEKYPSRMSFTMEQ